MTRAVRQQNDGLEVPVIQADLYAESCLLLVQRPGVIGTLNLDQIRSLGMMPDGPTLEIGRSPTRE